jgi:DNA-binding transcriptional ArsR family regulator
MSLEAHHSRLPGRLAARLDPKVQDALDHPIRREILRVLNRAGRPRSVAELGADLSAYRVSQLGYHLRVLQRSGTLTSLPSDGQRMHGLFRYASEVREDVQVRAVLRATEQGDRKQREATTAASVTALLTMFRAPRPIRTIRLRGRGKTDAESDS